MARRGSVEAGGGLTDSNRIDRLARVLLAAAASLASAVVALAVWTIPGPVCAEDRVANTSNTAGTSQMPPVIGATPLIDRLRDTSVALRILDIRSPADYAAGHLPGAVSLNADEWKEASFAPDGLDDQRRWSERIGGMGIDGKTDVVVYGSALPETARIWWLLKYCGVPSASVLDGGFPAWVAAGGPVEQVAAAPQPVGFSATFQPDRLIEIDELLLGDGEWLVIDNRSADEFTGRVARGARGGHIPGACSLDWVGFVDENGLLKPREQLRAMLAERGFGEKRTAITHCQTGGRSSVGALVVEWVTGEPARNYYRSWSEYAAHPTAPVEK